MKAIQIFLPIFLFVLLACSSEPKATDENTQMKHEEAPVAQALQDEAPAKTTEPEPTVETEPIKELSMEEWYAKLDREIDEEFKKLLQKDRPSILDYYLALPYDRVFDSDCQEPQYMTMERRKNRIKYKNIQSGYIQMGFPNRPLSSDDRVFVLFKSSVDNKDYIGSLRGNQCGDFPCGPLEGFCTLDSSGEWVDVNEQLFGQDDLTKKVWNPMGFNYSLILPEKGTSIAIVKCGSDTEAEQNLGQLVWKQTHFTAELTEAGEAFFQ